MESLNESDTHMFARLTTVGGKGDHKGLQPCHGSNTLKMSKEWDKSSFKAYSSVYGELFFKWELSEPNCLLTSVIFLLSRRFPCLEGCLSLPKVGEKSPVYGKLRVERRSKSYRKRSVLLFFLSNRRKL